MPCNTRSTIVISQCSSNFCKGTWLLHAQLFYAQQDFRLKLTDDHIVHKGTWVLHAQPFYAEKDVPLKLTDDHIVHKGTWLLHAQTFNVEQDLPLKLIEDHIVHKGIWLHHAQLFMLTKISLGNLLLSARVYDSFMHNSFMLSKMSLWSNLIITLSTRVLYP